jgi:hypothetical protein
MSDERFRIEQSRTWQYATNIGGIFPARRGPDCRKMEIS